MVDKVKIFLEKLMPMEEQDVALLMSMAEVRNFDRKIVIVYEGETEPYLNLVVKGIVRKYFRKGREEVVTQFASEGELISASDLFLPDTASLYCTETIEPTTFLSFSKDSVEMLFKKDPKWQRLGRLLISQLMIEKEYWELDKIRLTTQERFVKFINENSGLVARVPQKYLASYLGIQPETFSRLKNQFKESMALNENA